MKTTYNHIAENKRKSALIILLFPILLSVLISAVLFLLFYFGNKNPNVNIWPQFLETITYLIPGVLVAGLVWIVVSYFIGDKIILKGSGAHEIQKKDNPEIYRMVENISIAAGLPMPKVYIIDDESLNAFATGRDPKHGIVALTRGIIKKLNKQELEGVIAHEMAHIGNRDIRLMLLVIAGIGFCTFVGYMLLRAAARKSGNKNTTPIWVLGLAFLAFGYLVAPLIRLAISRSREYQADATAALITRNPRGLADALRKISTDSRVEAIDSNPSMAAMCISNPLKQTVGKLTATHPPINDRIKKLEEMDM